MRRLDPRAMGLVPFAPVRRRQDGEAFAYKVREEDMGRLYGFSCRMADPEPIAWRLGA